MSGAARGACVHPGQPEPAASGEADLPHRALPALCKGLQCTTALHLACELVVASVLLQAHSVGYLAAPQPYASREASSRP